MFDFFTDEVLQGLDNKTTLTYAGLCDYIQRFLARTDLDVLENIPRFIFLAEKRLATDLKFIPGIQVGQFSIDPSLPLSLPASVIVEKPFGWQQTKSMALLNGSGRSYLFSRSYEYLQTYLNDFTLIDLQVENNFDELIFYADYDNQNWIFGPYSRKQKYDFEVLYFSQIEPLNSTNQVNYWTEFAPRALLYAALYEASYYLRSDDRTDNQWSKNYQEAVEMLRKQSMNNFVDNSVQRTN